ncbi:hypothetical protein ACFL1X_03880 [Candidatus Hydrogenedentota bacterium]
MTIRQARKKAAGLKVRKYSRLTKSNLIRAIQSAEGNPQCFETGVAKCPENGCCFFSDCQSNG